MIRFVIVEDEEKYSKKIKEIINKHKYNISQEVKTYEFKGLTKQLENLIKNCDQRTIYILDIELNESKSGIEIASLIRENDWDSEIIFITNHDKMFETAHRTVFEVFDFIEKYHELESRLSADIKTILSKTVDKKMLTYRGRNVDLQLYLDSINYIYRDKEERKIIIVTDTSNFSICISLKDIQNYLDTRFKMVHRSCIINTDKVALYDWHNSKIVLKNKKEVYFLSKKFRKVVEDKC